MGPVHSADKFLKERKEKKEDEIILFPDFPVSQSLHSNVLPTPASSSQKAWVAAVCTLSREPRAGAGKSPEALLTNVIP